VRRRPLTNDFAVEMTFLPRGPMGYSRVVVQGFSRSPRFFLWPRDLPAVLALHLVAICAMSAAIALGRKKLRLASDLRDPACFVEGMRREDGHIEAGATIVNPPPSGKRRAAGPVLLRVVGVTAGEYRAPPSLRVGDVVPGTRASAARAADRIASAALASTGAMLGCVELGVLFLFM
jgi:hypothetical protein